MWMQDGCKVYTESYMASNRPCFTIFWTIFKNHLLEVSPTQNRETMALRMLTTVGLFYLIMCEDPHEHKLIEISFGWGPGHIRLNATLEDPRPHYMILEVCWDGLLDTFFWALTISWPKLKAVLLCVPYSLAFWVTSHLVSPGPITVECIPKWDRTYLLAEFMVEVQSLRSWTQNIHRHPTSSS